MKRTAILCSIVFSLSLVYLNLNARTSQKIVVLLARNHAREASFFVKPPQQQTGYVAKLIAQILPQSAQSTPMQSQSQSQPQTVQTQSQTQTQTQTGQTQTGQTQTLYIGFPAELSWKFKTPAPVIAQPQVDDTYVYVASRSGGVYRILQDSGKGTWRVNVGDSIEEAFLLDAGILFVATPRGVVFALNALTGKQIWRQSFEGETFLAQPAVDVASLFLVSREGDILCLARKDGTLRWKFKASGECTTTPYYFDSKVYVGCNDKNLYALDATAGFVKWKFIATSEIMGSPVAVAEGLFFGSEDGYGYWLDEATGRELWKVKTGGAIRGIPMIYYDERLQKNAEVIFASFDNFLYSLRIKDGGRKWLTGTVARVFNRMELDRALIFLVPFGPNVYGFDPLTGKRVGDFDATYRIRSSPTTGNDLLFLGLNDGHLLCLKRQPPPPPETAAVPHAQTQTQTMQSQTQSQTQTRTQTQSQTQTQTQVQTQTSLVTQSQTQTQSK